ncbi:YitT family protein [Sporosalibacterium faouarense]|uniref:YitT family protein n=1 Tax=Sporosalibacterium faouarense TaxID=516123 RepID=UPI00192B46DE|nr:YitT family protein [Sporosalibacterium faouarense]
MLLAKKARARQVRVGVKDFAEPLSKLGIIFIANFICAIGFNAFFIPNQLLSGGVVGLAIMTHYLTDLPTGLITLFINVPIFIIGSKLVDKKFAFYSFLSMLTLSFLLEATRGIHQYIQTGDMLIETIFGGVLIGLGMGLLFRNRVSQGGTDIIAAIMKKKYNIGIGTVLLTVNVLILGISSLLFGLRPAMYTLIALYISYQIVDKVQQGFDTKKTVIIVSSRPQELADAIIQKLHRGATFLNGEGAYNKDNKKIIYCTIMSTQVSKLKSIVDEIDIDAFITINDVNEVKGRGFKSIGI